jgi:hypothetical protein
VADCPARTPRRKIRCRFHGCKHTSLTFLAGKSSEDQLSSAQNNDPRSAFRNAWETVVL